MKIKTYIGDVRKKITGNVKLKNDTLRDYFITEKMPMYIDICLDVIRYAYDTASKEDESYLNPSLYFDSTYKKEYTPPIFHSRSGTLKDSYGFAIYCPYFGIPIIGYYNTLIPGEYSQTMSHEEYYTDRDTGEITSQFKDIGYGRDRVHDFFMKYKPKNDFEVVFAAAVPYAHFLEEGKTHYDVIYHAIEMASQVSKTPAGNIHVF